MRSRSITFLIFLFLLAAVVHPQKPAEAQPSPQLQRDAEQVRFLFLYREGSIEPDSVKRMADSLDLTIKYKSSPRRADRESAQGGKGKPISPTKPSPPDAPILRVGDIEEAFRNAGYGAKLTKADAARTNPGTPIEELFKEGNSVVGFNINTKENAVQLFELPIKLQGDTAKGIEKKDIRRGMVIAKPGSISPHRLIVFTFNQTPETLEEFKEVFCKLYHNDCRGPIGKPTPLPELVNVKRYFTFTPKNPILNERDLIRELDPYKKFLPFKDGFYSNEPNPDNYISVRCVDYLPNGKCAQWEVCGFTSDGKVKCILVNGLVGQQLCLTY